MTPSSKTLLIATIACLAVFPPAAQAKNSRHAGEGYERRHENSKERPEDRHESRHEDHDGDRITIGINFGDRETIQRYISDDYRRNCPPGLAKKHNGCLPPGQAKKWRIGHPLPGDVVFVPVSDDFLSHLGPVPRGYHYVRVDKDILLIGEATKKVIDAVTLLSAVGE